MEKITGNLHMSDGSTVVFSVSADSLHAVSTSGAISPEAQKFFRHARSWLAGGDFARPEDHLEFSGDKVYRTVYCEQRNCPGHRFETDQEG